MMTIKELKDFGSITFIMLKNNKEIDRYNVDKTIFEDYFNKNTILRECLNNKSFDKLRTRVKVQQKVECIYNLFCKS